MKLMQINLWGGRIQRPMLDLITAEAPDVILAQEVYAYPFSVPYSSPWGYFSILERIAKAGGYEHSYFSPSSTFTMFGRQLSYGNAILSKFPLTDAITHYTGSAGGPE